MDPHQPELASEPLTWEFTDELLERFTPEVEHYRERARHYQVAMVEVDRLLPVDNYPLKLSRDACARQDGNILGVFDNLGGFFYVFF